MVWPHTTPILHVDLVSCRALDLVLYQLMKNCFNDYKCGVVLVDGLFEVASAAEFIGVVLIIVYIVFSIMKHQIMLIPLVLLFTVSWMRKLGSVSYFCAVHGPHFFIGSNKDI
jgi:hypothetical protein